MTHGREMMSGHRYNGPRGTAHYAARLDDDAVRAIRANRHGLTRRQLAAHFGVHLRTVEKVCAFETWRHVR